MLQSVKMKVIDSRIGKTKPLPEYQTAGAAGIDLYACIESPVILQPGSCILIPTGIAIHIKNNQYCAIIAPRSGLGHKRGIVLGNLVGVIDSDYQGEVKVSCWNRGHETQTIEPMERIAQLLFLPVLRPNLEVVTYFEESERGSGGFGSTGS